ncbi:MAG: hypothetical protein QW343_02495 [Candidatus Norongarragalinales archaeon]
MGVTLSRDSKLKPNFKLKTFFVVRALIFFCVFLLAGAAAQSNANAFIDVGSFAFKIQPNYFYPIHYLLAPSSCDGFFQELRLPPTLSATKDYAQAAAYARQAQLALQESALYGRTQKIFAAMPAFNGIAGYAYCSMRCFEEGSRALALAGESARAALRATGANADDLQAMTNADYEGAAGGVLAEIREINADLRAGAVEGESLGKWINRAAATNDAVWNDLNKGIASSVTVFSAVKTLAGENFLLDELVAFNERVTRAIRSLEAEVDSLRFEAEDAEWRASGALAALEKEQLWLVGENAGTTADCDFREKTTTTVKARMPRVVAARWRLAEYYRALACS